MEKVDVGLGAAAMVFAVTCAVLLQRVNSHRDELEFQAARIARLEPSPAVEAAPSVAQPPAASQGARPSIAPADAESAGAQGGASKAGGSSYASLMQDPVARTAEVANLRKYLRQQIQDLPHWTPVSEHTMDALATVLAEHYVDLGIASEARAGEPEREALNQRYDAEILQVLGARQFSRWKIYRDAEEAREVIGLMNRQLPAGESLTSDRVVTIATAMSRAQTGARRELNALPINADSLDSAGRQAAMERQYESQKRAIALSRDAAATHLSPRQLQALDEINRVLLQKLEAEREMQRAGVAVSP